METKLLYRMRAIHRIIGEDNELDNTYIYLNDQKGFNDPMEGYMNTYFNADELLWRNFYRKYLISLTMIVHPIGILSNEHKLDHTHIKIYEYDKLTSSMKEHIDKIAISFFENKLIEQMIKESSKPERKLFRSELEHILILIHSYALNIVMNQLYPDINKYTKTDDSQNSLLNLLRLFGTENDVNEKMMNTEILCRFSN